VAVSYKSFNLPSLVSQHAAAAVAALFQSQRASKCENFSPTFFSLRYGDRVRETERVTDKE